MHGSPRVWTPGALELVFPRPPAERELRRQAAGQRLGEVIVAIGQSIRDRRGRPAAQLFARVATSEPDDYRGRSAVRTRNDQLLAALRLETVRRAPVARRLVLRRAPLVEVILVQQIYRNRTVAFFVDGHRRACWRWHRNRRARRVAQLDKLRSHMVNSLRFFVSPFPPR